MTPDEVRWNRILDELEAGAKALEVDLAAGGEVRQLETWQPPRDLPPIPESMRARTETIATRLESAELAARERRDQLQEELARQGRRRSAGTAYAAAARREEDVNTGD